VGGEVFGYLQEAIVQEGKNNFHLSIFNDIWVYARMKPLQKK
jgi:hypothetical protein